MRRRCECGEGIKNENEKEIENESSGEMERAILKLAHGFNRGGWADGNAIQPLKHNWTFTLA